jgi:integrase
MARKVRDSRLESRSARLRLAIRKKPYTGPSVARGIMLLYRRNRGNGTWVVKASTGHGAYWTKAFGESDDYEESDRQRVLTFHEAQDMAKRVARGDDDAANSKPLTVADALAAYERDLASRGAGYANVRRVRAHLPAQLAGKPVSMLSVGDLRHWRDALVAKGLQSSTINRTRVGLRAALELAAALDPARIKNREAFRLGLKGLPGATNARQVVLPDADVLKIVEAAYQQDKCFGVMVEVLAQTGARISQASRLRCCDLQSNRADPRVLLPSSFKGATSKERRQVPVPIPPGTAALLDQMRGDRDDDAPLLIKADGTRWQETNGSDYRDLFRAVVERAGFDPDHVTTYALRHSSICRALLNGVPTTIVGKLHDTSTKEIERHYAKYILDFSDAHARRALLQAPAGSNVVALPGRRS